MISCHSRWSIHSVWRDATMMLRLQRGEPVVYLNPKDAEKLGIADDGWSELSQRLRQDVHVGEVLDDGPSRGRVLLPRLGSPPVPQSRELQVADPG